MEILLTRINFNEKWTEGKLYVDGRYVCDTLEDKYRNLYSYMSEEEIMKNKVYGQTAIPSGRYKLTITWSNKFKKELIQINNVKGFQGVRIHSLNTAEESFGCVGVGKKLSDGYITQSRDTYKIVHSIVQAELDKGNDVWLEII